MRARAEIDCAGGQQRAQGPRCRQAVHVGLCCAMRAIVPAVSCWALPHLPQHVKPHLRGHPLHAPLPKDVLPVAAIAAREVAHVLHQPQQRHMHLQRAPITAECMREGDGRWARAMQHCSSAQRAALEGSWRAATFLNICAPRLASSKATSWGVDTMTAPDRGRRCPKLICASPVPAHGSRASAQQACKASAPSDTASCSQPGRMCAASTPSAPQAAPNLAACPRPARPARPSPCPAGIGQSRC